ncbi:MAG TPA: phage holin family protein [Jatrophihabitans sp.]|nr:phage holin family protein [Jatrophihabitans sp.]
MSVSAEPQRNAGSRPAEQPTIGELSSRLSEQMSRLVRDEIALAQAEAKQRAKQLGMGVGMFGTGGVFAFFAGACAVAGAVLGLTNVVPGWLAALIVAGVLFALAGIVALIGGRSVKKGSPPVPADAMQSVKADAEAVRNAVRHGRSEVVRSEVSR